MTQTAIEVALVAETSISAAGGVLAFFNSAIADGFHGGSCACSALESGKSESTNSQNHNPADCIPTVDRAALSLFLSVEAALEASIAGSLKMCAAGGFAEGLSASARASLSAWLSSPSCSLSASLKLSVQGWLSASVSVTHSGGDHGSAPLSIGGNVILGASAASSLSTFIASSHFEGLSVEIQAALHGCAAGGVSSVLSGAVQVSLSAWLSSSSCTLEASLKASVQAWLAGTLIESTLAATAADAYGYISVGASFAHNFNASGFMRPSAQASLSSFCSSSASLTLDVGILSSLKSCASGQHSGFLEPSAAKALAQWLASSSCSLDVELRGSIMLWLSFGITGASGASKGVGAGAGAGFILTGMAGELSSAISAEIGMSSACQGAIGLAISGQAGWAVSTAGRCELIAYLLSESARLSVKIEAALFGWIMGSDCSGVKSVGVSGPPALPSGSIPSKSSPNGLSSNGTSSTESSLTSAAFVAYPTVPVKTGFSTVITSTFTGLVAYPTDPSKVSFSTGVTSTFTGLAAYPTGPSKAGFFTEVSSTSTGSISISTGSSSGSSGTSSGGQDSDDTTCDA